MGYMKYLLYKTGWFPKCEPNVSDVLEVAIAVHEIKEVVTPNGRAYFYVFPASQDVTYLKNLMRLFRSNGVVLLPHRSRHYEGWVLRVPNHKQKFMLNVMRVNNDRADFQKLLLQRRQSNGR